eukprot:scaffold331622_cov54-Prasinocladus_malaysianus.AAC.1
MQVSLPHEAPMQVAPGLSSPSRHGIAMGYAMAAMMGTAGHEATNLKYRIERHDLASKIPISKPQSEVGNEMVATDAFGAICGAGSESYPMLVRSDAAMGEASQRYIADRRDGLQRKLLILGGLGGLGNLVSSWTMANGCNVVPTLLGRTGRFGGAMPSVSKGCMLEATSCDMSHEADLMHHTTCERMHSIFHAGGVLKDAMLSSQTTGSLRQVLAPKINQLERMEMHAYRSGIVSTILFSSVSVFLGTSGQLNYVAANAILDWWAK